MTVSVSDISSKLESCQQVPKQSRARYKTASLRLSEAATGITISTIAADHLNRKSSTNVGIAQKLLLSQIDLSRDFNALSEDPIVFQCSGFRESKLALIIECKSASSHFIVPKCGVVSFDFANPCGTKIQVNGIRALCVPYFIESHCRLIH